PGDAHQHHIDGREVELGDVLALDHTGFPADVDANGLARGDGVNLIDGELEFLEDIQHLAPDSAGGADYGHPVAHHQLSSFIRGGADYARERGVARPPGSICDA